ncbi:MAG: hypothetical protein KY476_24555, partial [Planctomycetes bacterium]|nr:hypothetical protein [Planctomycetota bacterium]
LLGIRYRRFFRTIFRKAGGAVLHWSSEVWPLQWRLAVQALFAYFVYVLFTPVLFHYHGPVVAGQMGMTWTVIAALQAAALAWVQTRVPRFGVHIQRGEFRELDRSFFRAASMSAVVMLAGGAAFWLGLFAADRWGLALASRLLPPLPAALFLLAALVQLVVACLIYYVRAHKREPFLAIGVGSSVAVGLAVWWLGARYGATGAGAGLLAVYVVITFPAHAVIWAKSRTEWH